MPFAERAVYEMEIELANAALRGIDLARRYKGWHVDHSTLKKKHALTFRKANAAIKERNQREHTKDKELIPWVLYSFRHTFLTRLGQSGCDAWTLARIAGHSSIAISSRYVHPSHDAVSDAMSRLSGHNIRHSGAEAKTSKPRMLRKWLKQKRKDGAPGEIRTPDLLLRRQSLYPAELRARTTEWDL